MSLKRGVIALVFCDIVIHFTPVICFIQFMYCISFTYKLVHNMIHNFYILI